MRDYAKLIIVSTLKEKKVRKNLILRENSIRTSEFEVTRINLYICEFFRPNWKIHLLRFDVKKFNESQLYDASILLECDVMRFVLYPLKYLSDSIFNFERYDMKISSFKQSANESN